MPSSESIDVERLIGYAIREGAGEVEVTLTHTRSTVVQAKNNIIDRSVTSETTLLGVRVSVGRKTGGAGGEISTMDQAKKIVDKAIKIARSAQEDPYWPGFNPNVGIASESVELYDKRTASVSVDELVGLLRDQIALLGDSKVVASEASLRVSTGYTIYASVHGGPVREEATSAAYTIEAKPHGGEGGYVDWYLKRRLETGRIEDTTRRAARRALDSGRAKPAGDLKGHVIFESGEAASIIMTILVPAISAYNVQQGRSPLAGRLGEQVLSERLTVVDDPFMPYETGSAVFDDEGHPTSRKSVFSRGVLETFLYDHYTASREGRESTGNGFRRAPWSSPSPAPTNLDVRVEGSKPTLEEAVSSVDEGLLVVSTIGSWLSNPVSGQINSTVTLGYIVRGGSIEEPVKSIALGGNFYEAFKSGVAGGASDKRCLFGVCSPSIIVEGISMAGAKR